MTSNFDMQLDIEQNSVSKTYVISCSVYDLCYRYGCSYLRCMCHSVHVHFSACTLPSANKPVCLSAFLYTLMKAVIHCVRQASTHADACSEIMVSTDNFRQHFICIRSKDRLNLLTFESQLLTGFPVGLVREQICSLVGCGQALYTPGLGVQVFRLNTCLTKGAAFPKV